MGLRKGARVVTSCTFDRFPYFRLPWCDRLSERGFGLAFFLCVPGWGWLGGRVPCLQRGIRPARGPPALSGSHHMETVVEKWSE
jgi:hypothetical protein